MCCSRLGNTHTHIHTQCASCSQVRTIVQWSFSVFFREKAAHFWAAFSCGKPMAHLFNIILLDQHLDMPHLSGGWIICAKEKCSLMRILTKLQQNLSEISVFCLHKRSLGPFASTHEKREQKRIIKLGVQWDWKLCWNLFAAQWATFQG